MNIKELSIQDTEKLYNTYMINDFPKNELKPLDNIINLMNKGICHSFGLYNDDSKEILLGYAIFIIIDNYKYSLLDYFAIVKELRGKNIGHEFFKIISPYFNKAFPHLQGFFIECESTATSHNDIDKENRSRRLRFYKSNNCIDTPLSSNLFGVEYNILFYPVNTTGISEYDMHCDYSYNSYFNNLIHRDSLEYIYKKIFSKNNLSKYVHLSEKLGDSVLSMPATRLAPYLIGKLLCRNINGQIMKYRITETECYYGEEDTACHAHKGRTERTKVLYEKGGTSYVYLCYGIHNLFNVVSGPLNHPEAVLIRGVEGYSGPGKLTKAMSIDRTLNNIDLTVSDILWLEDDGTKSKYLRSKRIGIDYATPKYRNILWRYSMKQ